MDEASKIFEDATKKWAEMEDRERREFERIGLKVEKEEESQEKEVEKEVEQEEEMPEEEMPKDE